jgi:hypothetical protein
MRRFRWRFASYRATHDDYDEALFPIAVAGIVATSAAQFAMAAPDAWGWAPASRTAWSSPTRSPSSAIDLRRPRGHLYRPDLALG